MNLTGKQKSQLLISLIEEKSADVLNCLSKESATLLSASLEDLPELNDQQVAEFLENVINKIEQNTHVSDSEDEINFSEDGIEETNIDDLDDSFDEQDDDQENKKSSYPENYRSCDLITEKLLEQKNQIIAFFLSKCDETLATDIKKLIPVEKVDEINTIIIENIPMSDKIYKKLFDIIVIKSQEEQDLDQQNDLDTQLDI